VIKLSSVALRVSRMCVLALVILVAGGGAASTSGEAGNTGPVAKDAAFVCPSGHNPYDIRLWLHVTRWCIEPGVRKQVQVKVQMMIHNRNDKWLDIRQERIRLIVHEFNRDDWLPPRIGEPTRDRPIHTNYEGEEVWAIPANAERAYDPLLNPPGLGTFATHWEVSRLAPKTTFIPHDHYGDLVFYMPMPADGGRAKPNIVGIAYVKNGDIIALCPPDKWQHHVGGGTF
jgi:hypothetical protein